MSAPVQYRTEHYVWSVEGKPVSVHLNLDVVRRLQPSLETTLERTPEIGGILLGYLRKIGDVIFVSVEDFEFVLCEHTRSESWHLSAREKQALHGRVRRLARDRGTRPVAVGWFRTHTRRGLYLDQHDFHLFRDYFPDPSAIVLLIRPERPRSIAGFFFREGTEIQRSFPLLSFPFAVEALAVSHAPEILPDPPIVHQHVVTRFAAPRREWRIPRLPPIAPHWQKAVFSCRLPLDWRLGFSGIRCRCSGNQNQT